MSIESFDRHNINSNSFKKENAVFTITSPSSKKKEKRINEYSSVPSKSSYFTGGTSCCQFGVNNFVRITDLLKMEIPVDFRLLFEEEIEFFF